MARLRDRANTARGAAHFLRRRWGGCATPAPGDSHGGPAPRSSTLKRGIRQRLDLDVRFSITPGTKACQCHRAIPEDAWTPIRLLRWTGAADVAETTYIPFQMSPTPRRCGSSSGG